MDNVSRPLIALLVGTVAFFALWIVALKPSSSGSGSSGGAGQYQSAINKARHAVGTSAAASVAHGGTVVTTPARASSVLKTASTKAATTPATTTAPAIAATTVRATTSKTPQPAAAAKHRLDVVTRALVAHRVLALLFYNPAAADDRAVKQELATVPVHGHKVVKLIVPLNELSRYTVVTNQVPVNEDPTLVLIDGHGQASTIVGFADRFEIAQRVADALAVK